MHFSSFDETVSYCNQLKLRAEDGSMSKRNPELDVRWGTICTPTGMKVVDGKYYLSLILMLSSLVFPLESGVFLFVGL